MKPAGSDGAPLRKIGRFVRNILIGAALGGLMLLTAAVLTADRFLFHPPQTREAPAAERSAVLPDGEVLALFYLPPGSEQELVILYSHGNAEDLSGIAPLLHHWRRAGFGVLSYDYPGYGRSGGRPSEKGVIRNAEAAWRYLTAECGIRPDRIVVAGFSVGSGPACHLAEKFTPAALVLLAPFTSAFQVVLPGVKLPFDRFPNWRRMGRIAAPVWILHGTADRVIAPEHGKRLFDLAPGPGKRLELLPETGHGDLPWRFDPAGLRGLPRPGAP